MTYGFEIRDEHGVKTFEQTGRYCKPLNVVWGSSAAHYQESGDWSYTLSNDEKNRKIAYWVEPIFGWEYDSAESCSVPAIIYGGGVEDVYRTGDTIYFNGCDRVYCHIMVYG